jgi:hypothetical protein
MVELARQVDGYNIEHQDLAGGIYSLDLLSAVLLSLSVILSGFVAWSWSVSEE